MRSVRQQHVEQIVGIIANRELTAKEAQAINDGDGWAFDICYDHQEYSEGWFTRVCEVSLSSEDLAVAWALAQVWDVLCEQIDTHKHLTKDDIARLIGWEPSFP